MEIAIDFIFMAVIVALFLANTRLDEIHRSAAVFGAASLTKPRNATSIAAYVDVAQNSVPLRRYFYWRNILKILFGCFCLSGTTYLVLLGLTFIKITPINSAQPESARSSAVVVEIEASGTSYHKNRYELESFLVISQTEDREVKAYSLSVPESEGKLVWVAGNGTLTEVNVGTALQLFGVMSVFLGIATFAIATVVRQSD